MTTQELTDLADLIVGHINRNDLAGLAETIAPCATAELVEICERLGDRHRAVMYRLLPKQRALEVFEALDPALRQELLREIHRLTRDEGIGVLLISHHPQEARDVADRLALLEQGRIVFCGAASALDTPEHGALRRYLGHDTGAS